MKPQKYIVVASDTIVVTEPGQGEVKGVVDYKQGADSREMYFTLYCKDMPTGSTVGLSCSAPGTRPPLYIAPTVITTSPSFTIGMACEVPADFEGEISFYVRIAPGTYAPVGASLNLQVAYPVPE